jgi:hypothetical protein
LGRAGGDYGYVYDRDRYSDRVLAAPSAASTRRIMI